MALKENTQIVNYFKSFNSELALIFNPNDINKKDQSIRADYVNLQLRDLFNELSSTIENSTSFGQIIIEINTSISIINEQILQTENQKMLPSTRAAIKLGAQLGITKLSRLKSVIEAKKSSSEPKYKVKYNDVNISEKEYALFIILAEKYGLISKIPTASEKADAFSSLTNISFQNLRETIGGKYKLDYENLLLKREHLAILKQALMNICEEIDLVYGRLTI